MSPVQERLEALSIVLEAAANYDLQAEVMAEYGRKCQEGCSRTKAAYQAAFEWDLAGEVTQVGRERQESREKEQFRETLEDLDLDDILNDNQN